MDDGSLYTRLIVGSYEIVSNFSWYWESFLDSQLIDGLKPLLLAFGIAGVMGILLVAFLHIKLRQKMSASLEHHSEVHSTTPDDRREHTQEIWRGILKRLAQNQNDSEWKLAILEADDVLKTLLTELGYPGETVADKLKLIKHENMATKEFALEAHRMRTRIAQEGDMLKVDRVAAERVLALYARVFNEFNYI